MSKTNFLTFLPVLDCQTDSEDLIYAQGRTSSCSAPPDLLIVADKSTDVPLKTELSSSLNEENSQTNKDNKLKDSTKEANTDSKDCHKSKPNVRLEVICMSKRIGSH